MKWPLEAFQLLCDVITNCRRSPSMQFSRFPLPDNKMATAATDNTFVFHAVWRRGAALNVSIPFIRNTEAFLKALKRFHLIAH